MGVGGGIGDAVGIGVGMAVGAGVEVADGVEVEVGAGGVEGTRAVVGVGVGACAINNSSIASEMVSKDGEPSNLTPVALGSLLSTKMVGVTETSLRRARLMSL